LPYGATFAVYLPLDFLPNLDGSLLFLAGGTVASLKGTLHYIPGLSSLEFWTKEIKHR
jgi:hypothetical protein